MVTHQARKNLIDFSIATDPKYQDTWFHETMAIIFQSVLKKVENGEDARIILTVPPRHGKSELATMKFPAWALGKHPEWPIIIASYSGELAIDFGQGTREIMQSPAYRDIFETRLRPDTKAKGKWMTQEGGGYTAAGAGGAITGKGFKIGIIDDILKNREEAESELIRDSRWDWYRSTFYTRQEGISAIVVIGTRWHTDDLIGRLIAKEEEDGANDEKIYDKWTVIKFPAIAIQDEDYRKKGEALWPQKFPIEKLRKNEITLGPYEFCTPFETPILMSDWTTKPISQVKVGDTVVGFTQDKKPNKGILVPSKVLATNSLIDDVCDIVLTSGRKVRCTRNHRWYTGRTEGAESSETRRGRKPYAPINIRKTHGGSRLMFIEEPFEKELNEREKILWNYLAGIIDGEGHIANSAIMITQTIPKNKPVADKIRSVLVELDLGFKEASSIQKRKGWSRKITFAVRNPRMVYRKLLRYTDIAKKQQIIDVLFRCSHQYIKEEDKVLNIKDSGKEKVFSLQTETGNYVAWGYGSSNSALYQASPITSENQEFKQEWIKTRTWAEIEALQTRKFATIDPGGKEAENDYTGIVRNYIDRENKWNFKAMRVHFDSKELINYIFKLHDEGFEKIGFEETVYLKAIEPFFKEECIKRKRFPNIIPLKHYKTQKEVRIRGLIPRYSNGGIYHIEGECKDLENEMVIFPKGAYDDTLDTASMQNEIAEIPISKYEQTQVRREREKRMESVKKGYGL